MCTEVLLQSMKVVLGLLCPEPQRESLGGQPATQCQRPKEIPVEPRKWAATREKWF